MQGATASNKAEGIAVHQLTQRLIDRIYAQTKEGAIRWREGAEKNAFVFDADDFSVVVEATASTVSIAVTDAEGANLETLDEEDLSAVASAGGRDYESIAREIHQDARRVALGTDDAIARILRALGDDGDEGEGGSRRW